MPHDVLIFDALRTPRGRARNGSLHSVKPVTLTTGLLDATLSRNPQLDPTRIDDLILGCVSPLRDQGADIARTAVLAAGLPETIAGVQMNRFCASGLEAVNTAAQKIASGWESLVLAGGVESMTRVPMSSDGGAWANDPETNLATGFVPQGIGADLIATLAGWGRHDVDAFAVESQTRAAKAWADSAFNKSIVPVRDRNGVVILDKDEHMRPDTTIDDLARLKPAFANMGAAGFDAVALQKYHWLENIDHMHTGGNSSGIVDGAALVVLGNDSIARELGLRPRGRIVSTAVTGSDPTLMLTGPAPASRKALAAAALRPEDIDLWEINEAFASVALRFMQDMDISHEQVNVNGGAIALGHPLGATGAMLVGTILDELERRDLHRGLVTLCVGGGMGIATIIERI
ncbi:acetyl-CoA C-acetyltransferase [Arthrobacter sp. SLBN-100]|uniref:acetyl-CoA C-acetyltransferase n=1 Tax=Arthrobacter sp. SLBN-100 TaxID=2768450 RepID=UPI001152D0FD|nr:acetyl-CoA C-acetyltransferase [Arthrobacter sp. SLBN-100]TQJ62238.1 acetyl-CoA C-acetyltransferase [Arthrobacter sp. SLBN-100]